jgi:hypothetical protein
MYGSAAEARSAKDVQGIPWERLNLTKKNYRKARLEQYKNYENFLSMQDAITTWKMFFECCELSIFSYFLAAFIPLS